MLAMLFGLFTLCMVCEQITTVSTNQTSTCCVCSPAALSIVALISHVLPDWCFGAAIDRMKGGLVTGERRSMMENLAEVFGGTGPSITWILPTQVHFENPELSFGYIVTEDQEPLVAADGTVLDQVV